MLIINQNTVVSVNGNDFIIMEFITCVINSYDIVRKMFKYREAAYLMYWESPCMRNHFVGLPELFCKDTQSPTSGCQHVVDLKRLNADILMKNNNQCRL